MKNLSQLQESCRKEPVQLIDKCNGPKERLYVKNASGEYVPASVVKDEFHKLSDEQSPAKIVARTCHAEFCPNKARKGFTKPPGLSYFNFPFDSNQTVRQKWLQAIGRPNWDPPQYLMLCSAHFTPDSFTNLGGRVSLKEGAIPTLFPQRPPNSSIPSTEDEERAIIGTGDLKINKIPSTEDKELVIIVDLKMKQCSVALERLPFDGNGKPNMMPSLLPCCVPRCSSLKRMMQLDSTSKKELITYHRFPDDPVKRVEWFKAIRNHSLNINTVADAAVCSSHFKLSDFVTKLGSRPVKRLLKPNAIPSVNIQTANANLSVDAISVSSSVSGSSHRSPPQTELRAESPSRTSATVIESKILRTASTENASEPQLPGFVLQDHCYYSSGSKKVTSGGHHHSVQPMPSPQPAEKSQSPTKSGKKASYSLKPSSQTRTVAKPRIEVIRTLRNASGFQKPSTGLLSPSIDTVHTGAESNTSLSPAIPEQKADHGFKLISSRTIQKCDKVAQTIETSIGSSPFVRDLQKLEMIENDRRKLIEYERKVESLELELDRGASKKVETAKIIKQLRRTLAHKNKCIEKHKGTIESLKKEIIDYKVKNRLLREELDDLEPIEPKSKYMPTDMTESVASNITGDSIDDGTVMKSTSDPDGHPTTDSRLEGGSSEQSKESRSPPTSAVKRTNPSSGTLLTKKPCLSSNSNILKVVGNPKIQSSISQEGTIVYNLKSTANVKRKRQPPSNQSISVQIDESEFQAFETLTEEGAIFYHLMKRVKQLK